MVPDLVLLPGEHSVGSASAIPLPRSSISPSAGRPPAGVVEGLEESAWPFRRHVSQYIRRLDVTEATSVYGDRLRADARRRCAPEAVFGLNRAAREHAHVADNGASLLAKRLEDSGGRVSPIGC